MSKKKRNSRKHNRKILEHSRLKPTWIVTKIFAINLYHHSHCLATPLDFTTWPFCTGPHLFLNLGWGNTNWPEFLWLNFLPSTYIITAISWLSPLISQLFHTGHIVQGRTILKARLFLSRYIYMHTQWANKICMVPNM